MELTKPKIQIIAYSLEIEYKTSKLLCMMLNIPIEKSKIFGNKGSSISFAQKIDLLIDTDYISDSDRRKFRLFMEIRNQFAHNINMNNYLDIITYVDNKPENFLNNNYPVESKDVEQKINKQINMLYKDIDQILVDVESRIITEAQNDIKKELLHRFDEKFETGAYKAIVELDILLKDYNIEEKQLNRIKWSLIGKMLGETLEQLDIDQDAFNVSIVKKYKLKLQ